MSFKVNDIVRMKKDYSPSSPPPGVSPYNLIRNDVGIIKEISPGGATKTIKWLRINQEVPFRVRGLDNIWVEKL